jgi:DNA invertase Pin-like site-specific DNA recombinase
MANGKYISYCRVSTQKQGNSGLGLESQQKAIADYINGSSWELIGEYVEVESGKKNDRPKLNEALKQCSLTGSTLIIAKLDRLARNVAFISRLMESNVEFVAVDFPEANRLTVHILAAVAEHEGRMISERIKAAYQAYKARGGKQYNIEQGKNGWGNPDNLTSEHQVKGSSKGNQQKQIKADLFANNIYPMIQSHQEEGLSLRQVAKLFNEQGILSARGKTGSWTATTVRNITLRGVSR